MASAARTKAGGCGADGGRRIGDASAASVKSLALRQQLAAATKVPVTIGRQHQGKSHREQHVGPPSADAMLVGRAASTRPHRHLCLAKIASVLVGTAIRGNRPRNHGQNPDVLPMLVAVLGSCARGSPLGGIFASHGLSRFGGVGYA
jgi:hypothetical protein